MTPDPVTPDPVTPDPVTPDPVTPDPVTPDAMTPDPMVGAAEPSPSIASQPLPAAIVTLWRVALAVEVVVVVVGAGIVSVVVGEPLVIGAAAVLVAGWAALRWWVIDLRYRNWRWGLDERWIERRSGVVVRTTQIVPRSRVQTLTTRTGPIDRWLGLSSIVVHTAGTHTPNLTIPHLDAAAAEYLRVELGG